jgi:predicted DNA-binding transcriptional regulator AlpA
VSAAQIEFAKKAAAKKAAAKRKPAARPSAGKSKLVSDTPPPASTHGSAHRARAPPAGEHLLDKDEILALTGVSFPTIWSWMRQGRFPRSRVVGAGRSSKSVWLSNEVEAWLRELPVRKLKGDEERA